MKGVKDVVIVEIEKTHEDVLQCGSLKLEFDPDYNPTGNARIYGTVTGLPARYSDTEYEGQLQKGDTVYFHFNVVEDSHIEGNQYGVLFERIFAVEKGECKCLNAVGNWCLLKADMEHGEKVLVDGKKVEVRKKGDLIVGIGKNQSAEVARVAYIRDNQLGVQNGDLVALEPDFEFENIIKGEKYFCNKQEYILAVIN